MLDPVAMRADGWTDDEIVQILMANAHLSEPQARSWVKALERGEQPWKDLNEQFVEDLQ